MPKAQIELPYLPDPTGDRVVIEFYEPDKITESGLIIPDTVRQEYSTGKIVKMGDGDYGLAFSKKIDVGSIVAYYYQNAIELFGPEIDGKKAKYHVVRGAEVWGVIE
jgi:co-chaperonin GroES (HSP10)